MIEYFKQITGYNLQAYLVRANDYINQKYSRVLAYYAGDTTIDKTIFKELDYLLSEGKKISGIFETNTNNLSANVGFWDLLDTFEDLQIKLLTIKNTPKWSRSSYTNNYESDTDIDYTQKENETFEEISAKLENDLPQDDWVDIAIKNGILESDYSKEGGALLKVTFQNNTALNVNSVVDVMNGESILGKDLHRGILFSGDDFSILSPTNTVLQSAKIKLEVRKTSIPEYPNLGISIFEGSTANFIRYPIIFREISQIFAADDTFKSVEIINIKKDQDVVFMDILIRSKLENVLIPETINL